MKKRNITMLLAALLTVNACSSQSAQTDKSEKPVSESSVKEEKTEEEKKEEKKDNTAAGKETIEETVLLDEAGIKITAKSLSPKGFYGPEIKMLIENTSGQSLTVQCRDSSVNGYMIETSMSADVADGKKTNDSLSFMESDLQAAGIETFADMEFRFHIFDSSTWDTYLDTEMITLKTSAAENYEYTFNDSGTPLYEGGGIRIIAKGLSDKDSWLGPSVLVYIENVSERNITVQARDVSVNGFMTDAVFSCDVTDGKHAVDTITFMRSDLEENEIEKIEDVELSFHIFDADSWDTIEDTDTIAIHF